MPTDNGGVGALLAVWVEVPADLKDDFDRWYLDEHLPERQGLPGFLSAKVFEPVDGGEQHVAFYELESLQALETPEYDLLRQQPDTELGKHIRANWKNQNRRVYTLRSTNLKGGRRPLESPYLSAVRAGVLPGHEAELREWLDAEHSVRQVQVEGAEGYQGFEPVEAPFYFLNLWGLERPDVASSQAWADARETPWRDKLAAIRGETTGVMLQPVG